MSRILLRAGLIAAAVLSPAPAQAVDTAAGLWAQIDDRTGKVRSHIRISEHGSRFGGHITRLFLEPHEPQNPVCDLCPGALRNKPIVGLGILQGMRREGRDYRDGSLLDPETGETYHGVMTMSPDGRTLTMRGFVLSPLFGRSQTWRRLE